MSGIELDGYNISISNPEKLLWPEAGIRKIDYLKTLAEIAPYMLPHTSDKALTSIRYPHGVGDKSFYQKRPPAKPPEFVNIVEIEGDTFINLNNLSTLLWLGNLAVMEFHTPFCRFTDGMLTELVFDMDPSEGQTFADAAHCALRVRETLDVLGIESLAKTSGASGLQIYIPTGKLSFEQGRSINEFFGRYFAEKYPEMITIERQVKKRGTKLYFDYLQMWRGKNIISVYSPRAVACGAVSTPVTWGELERGINPCDFNVTNITERLKNKGDMFEKLLRDNENSPALDEILRTSGA